MSPSDFDFDFIDDGDDDDVLPQDDGPESSAEADGLEAERIAKVLARSGVCSRRDAEKLIASGRVKLNGRTVETPATLVTAADTLTVDGKPVAKPQTTRVWRYHKPPGLVTTHHDPQGRPTVFDAMPSTMPRVISVGRLDLNSEGLLLLTNDGALARQFEHPSNGWTRRYRVRVFGAVDPARLATLARGVTVEGVVYGAIQAELERQSGANSWLTVTLTEGKNREIRKVMDHLGYRVNRLIRVSYGPFYIGRLERGEIEEIPPKMLAELLDNVARAGSVDDVKPVRLDRTGWAKAKPKPVRPGSRRPDFDKKAEDRRLDDDARRPGRPGGPRQDGGRPFAKADGDRPARRSWESRSGESRSGEEAAGSDRKRPFSGGKPGGQREGDERPRGSRPFGDRPNQGRPNRDRPQEDRPQQDRPRQDRPRQDGPRQDRSQDDRPQRGRDHREDRSQDKRPPSARPTGGRPRSDGPRSDGPRSGPSRSGPSRSGPPRSGGPRSGGPRPSGPRSGGSKR